METASVATILTIKQVAEILQCSKTHVTNVLNGRVAGLPRLTHLCVGRRKLIRKDWLDRWMEENSTR
jgi:excisionase family DNA binding protein